jgi:hypothetical protein
MSTHNLLGWIYDALFISRIGHTRGYYFSYRGCLRNWPRRLLKIAFVKIQNRGDLKIKYLRHHYGLCRTRPGRRCNPLSRRLQVFESMQLVLTLLLKVLPLALPDPLLTNATVFRSPILLASVLLRGRQAL